jgi:protein ImuB
VLDSRTRALWHALQFTPRVTWAQGQGDAQSAGDVLLAEVSASVRLFGGLERLETLFFEQKGQIAGVHRGFGATSLIAIARWHEARLRAQTVSMGAADRSAPGLQAPPAGFPLEFLAAARPHADVLARMGCRTWGQLRELPRDGVARRFGAGLLRALDQALGVVPEAHVWCQAPERFDLAQPCDVLLLTSDDLLMAAAPLLEALRVWLKARQLGVLALELRWTHDWKRANGQDIPNEAAVQARTAKPVQDVKHLVQLLREQLAQTELAAPARQVGLCALDTRAFEADCARLWLDEAQGEREGEPWHQMVERLSARLGAHNVVVPQLVADHRPERQQIWLPAVEATKPQAHTPSNAAQPEHTPNPQMLPTWLLPQPLPLEVINDVPQAPNRAGPLQRLSRMHRVETAWWAESGATLRDYFIAWHAHEGWLWIYRERPASLFDALGNDAAQAPAFNWFLQGRYA